MPYKLLVEAIELGNKDRIQKMLEENPSFNLNEIQGSRGVPLMNVACRFGNLDIIRLLYQYGAKISMNMNYYRYSPLTEAIKARQEFVVAWLLKNGADVNEEDNAGYIPLTTTAECLSHQEGRGSLDRILTLILNHNEIEIDQSDPQGYTALYILAQWGELDYCATLLKRGAQYKSYRYTDFIEYIHLILQNRRETASRWLQEKTPKDIHENAENVKENITAIFKALIVKEKYAYAKDLINTKSWGRVIQKEIHFDSLLKSAVEDYIHCIKRSSYCAYDELRAHLRRILFCISLGLYYSKEKFNSSGMPYLMFLITSVPRQMIQELETLVLDSPAYQEFLKNYNEGRFRKMLGHRFGLKIVTRVKDNEFSVEGTQYCSGVLELKYAYKHFLEDKVNLEKLYQLLNDNLRPLLQGHIKQAEFEDTGSKNIIAKTAFHIQNIFSNDWYQSAGKKIKMNEVFLVPVTTCYPDNGSDFDNHEEAFALFGNRLLKMNRGMGAYESGIEVYKTKFAEYDQEALGSELEMCMDSIKDNLNGQGWEKGLMDITNARFLRTLHKKPQKVGNCGWATAKLLVFAAVYANIFLFCKAHTTLKVTKADDVAELIAKKWYKLFTTFDRCYALEEYLWHHSETSHQQPLITGPNFCSSVYALQRFIQQNPMLDVDQHNFDMTMLQEIYRKQIKKLVSARKEQSFDKSDSEVTRIILRTAKAPQWNWLEYIVEQEDLLLLEQILEMPDQVSYDSEGNNILHYIARSGKYKFLIGVMEQRFIDRKLIFETNNVNNNPLAEALYNRHWDIATYLVGKEPELIKDPCISTCLESACDWEEYECIDFILQNGGSIPISIEIDKCHPGVEYVLNEYVARKKAILTCFELRNSPQVKREDEEYGEDAENEGEGNGEYFEQQDTEYDSCALIVRP